MRFDSHIFKNHSDYAVKRLKSGERSLEYLFFFVVLFVCFGGYLSGIEAQSIIHREMSLGSLVNA